MSLSPFTIERALAEAAERLAGVSESPRLDAEVLLAWILDVSRSYLFAHSEAVLEVNTAQQLSDALSRRHQAEPVAYITGTK